MPDSAAPFSFGVATSPGGGFPPIMGDPGGENTVDPSTLEAEGTVSAGGSLGWTTVTKVAIESVAASTALQDDNELFFAVQADYYLFQFELAALVDATGDFKIAWVVSTGTVTGNYTATGPSTIGAASVNGSNTLSTATNWGASSTIAISVHGHGIILPSTAATFKLQWAQAAASGTTYLLPGSRLLFRQL